MNPDFRKTGLSPARRRLLELMQRISFGRIEGLVVCDGQPVFDPPPRVVRKVKIGGENGSRPEATAEDFALRKEVVEFFGHIEALRAGVVGCIEVKNGVPFSMEVDETARA